MSRSQQKIAIISLSASIFSCACSSVAVADSLRAVILKGSFLPDEPLAIEVTLCLDEPVVVDFIEDPQEAEKQLRRLRRQLHVELRDQDGSTVAKSFLFGVEFLQPKDPSKEFSTSALAFWAMPIERRKGAPILTPGNYVVVVFDRGHGLESNEVPLEILAPRRKEQEAAELFRASLPGGALVILEQKDVAAALSRFQELARDYPETVYGKYARVSLALMCFKETRAEHNIKGGPAVWNPVVNDLVGVKTLFTGRHPLREMVLYHLTSALVFSGDYAGARKSLAALKSTFPRGKLGSRSEQFEKEITQLEKQQRSAETDGE